MTTDFYMRTTVFFTAVIALCLLLIAIKYISAPEQVLAVGHQKESGKKPSQLIGFVKS